LGAHVPALQKKPPWQGLVSEQVVSQTPATQRVGQGSEMAARHTPLPSQVRAEYELVPKHDGAWHSVPSGCTRQALFPSQVPSCLHAETGSSEHSLSGSWPAGTAVQVPTEPGNTHDEHLVAQLSLQQTPSTHSPDWQSLPLPHERPLGRFAGGGLLFGGASNFGVTAASSFGGGLLETLASGEFLSSGRALGDEAPPQPTAHAQNTTTIEETLINFDGAMGSHSTRKAEPLVSQRRRVRGLRLDQRGR
jgi:hypothetical protein